MTLRERIRTAIGHAYSEGAVNERGSNSVDPEQYLEAATDQAIQQLAPFERVQELTDGLAAALHGFDLSYFQDQANALPVMRDQVLKLAALHQRVFDLLRQQRSELSEAKLITLPEYGWLAAEAAYFESGDPSIPGQGSLAVQRLERYDEHEAKIAKAVVKLKAASDACEEHARLFESTGRHEDKKPAMRSRARAEAYLHAVEILEGRA